MDSTTIRREITTPSSVKPIIIGPTVGQEIIEKANQVFSGGMFGLDKLGSFAGIKTTETPVSIYEQSQDGYFSDFLGSSPEHLERRRLEMSQVVEFSDAHRDKLKGGYYSTFFILTKDGEITKRDLSNVRVAAVCRQLHGTENDPLQLNIFDFLSKQTWSAFAKRFIVYPEQFSLL